MVPANCPFTTSEVCMQLEGKVAIVTGGAGNLGSACARLLAIEGAVVIVSDLPGVDVKSVVDDIVQSGGQAIGHQGDVSHEPDVIDMVGTSLSEHGRLDVLINVAAAMSLVVRDEGLDTMSVDTWDRVMAVNVRGPMLSCKHAIPAMLSQGAGSIVNFASTAAFVGDDGRIAYATSKAALLGFTRSIATTYGKEGIRCNAVAPGSVWSEATKAHMGHEQLDLMNRTRLTPRLGVPDDIAHMVVYLASDKSTYITGQTFLVDGGGTAHQPWVRVR
jgi:NAD(P)-dependent dehydrogenase (short-subunit alcohol dehydrogenase family)